MQDRFVEASHGCPRQDAPLRRHSGATGAKPLDIGNRLSLEPSQDPVAIGYA
jgi:hypothetical protein